MRCRPRPVAGRSCRPSRPPLAPMPPALRHPACACRHTPALGAWSAPHLPCRQQQLAKRREQDARRCVKQPSTSERRLAPVGTRVDLVLGALSLVAARIQQVENLSPREKSHPTGGGPPCVGPGGRPRGNDRMSCLPWSPLERFRLWCGTGFGAAKVSSRRQGKPKAPRAFADPFAYRSWFAVPSLHASQMRSSPSGGRPRAARGASPAAANAPRRCGSGRCSKGSPGRRRPGSRGCSSAGRGD